MSEAWVVLKREFLERVRTKMFLISTLLFPLFIGAMWALPMASRPEGGEQTLVLVDQAPRGVADYVASTLTTRQEGDEDAITYRLERVAGPLEQVRTDLNRRVEAKEIDGYVYLPADILESNQATFRARNIANFEVLRDIRRAVSGGAQAARMMSSGMNLAQVSAVIRPVELNTARITERGEEGSSADATFAVAFIFGVLIYFSLIFYGMNVMRSVLEEKTSRIAEVIVSSMDAGRLMLGKIVGIALVALLQMGIWGVILAIVLTQTDVIAERFGLPPDAMNALRIEPWVWACLVAFFLLGFFLYAALFAAVGAAVTSEQEAQQLQFAVLLPLIAPLAMMTVIATDPLGKIATWFGLIPFSAPLAMPVRMAATAIPAWQIAASLALLLVAVVFVTWLAGKIYRVGILSTGKRPTLQEVGRWLRAA